MGSPGTKLHQHQHKRAGRNSSRAACIQALQLKKEHFFLINKKLELQPPAWLLHLPSYHRLWSNIMISSTWVKLSAILLSLPTHAGSSLLGHMGWPGSKLVWPCRQDPALCFICTIQAAALLYTLRCPLTVMRLCTGKGSSLHRTLTELSQWFHEQHHGVCPEIKQKKRHFQRDNRCAVF